MEAADAGRHATEQLHLVIATLAFMKLRLPEARRFARAELRTFVALAEGMAGLADDAGLRREAMDAERVLLDPDADTREIELASRSMRDQVTACYSRSGDGPLAGPMKT